MFRVASLLLVVVLIPSAASLTFSEVVELPLAADARIRSGDFDDVNFDQTGLSLAQGCPIWCEAHLESLLRIDVSDVPVAVLESATLRVYLHSDGTWNDTGTIYLHRVSDDDWDESEVTWLTAPGPDWETDSDEAIASAGPYTSDDGLWVEFDLTAAVKDEAVGDGLLSLRMVPDGDYQNIGHFYDREHSDDALRPRLELDLLELPPAVQTIDGAQVSIALNAVTEPLDSIELSLTGTPFEIDIDSVAIYLTELDPDADFPGIDAIEVEDPDVDITVDGDSLSVSGAGFNLVTFDTTGPVDGEMMTGESTMEGITEDIFHGGTMDELGGLLDDYTRLQVRSVNDKTNSWAEDQDPDDLPVVYLNSNAEFDTANGMDSSTSWFTSWICGFCCNNRYANPYEIGVEVSAGLGGSADAVAWSGTGFAVRGCDDRDDTESDRATVNIPDLYREGRVMNAGFLVVTGAANAEMELELIVKEWALDSTGEPIVSSGRVVNADIVATDDAIWQVDYCANESDLDETEESVTVTLREDHMYLAYVKMRGHAWAVAGAVAAMDYYDEDWNYGQESCDACLDEDNPDDEDELWGASWSTIEVNWIDSNLPDLDLVDDDLRVDNGSGVVISGSRTTFNLQANNFGSADAFNVETEFEVDAVRVCDDPDETATGLPQCPELDTLPWCDSEHVAIDWCATGLGPVEVSAVLDPDLTVNELDETNNIAAQTVCVIPPPTQALAILFDRSDEMNESTVGGYKKSQVAEDAAHAEILTTEACAPDATLLCGEHCQPQGDAATFYNVACDNEYFNGIERALPLTFCTTDECADVYASCDYEGRDEVYGQVTLYTTQTEGTQPVYYGDMALWDSVAEGARALCCLNGSFKEIWIFTAGVDGCSEKSLSDACSEPPTCGAVPIVLVPDLPELAENIQEDLEECIELGLGGLFQLPDTDDEDQISDRVGEIDDLIQTGWDSGLMVLPVGHRIFDISLFLEHVGPSFNVKLVDPEFDLGPEFTIVVTPPSGVSFAEEPELNSSGLVIEYVEFDANELRILIGSIDNEEMSGVTIVKPELEFAIDYVPTADGAVTMEITTDSLGDLIHEASLTIATTEGEPCDDPDGCGVPFLRGDADGNGNVFAILDTLYILEYGFTNGPAPVCEKTADVDGNGSVFPIVDALYLLEYGFTDGPAPPTPGPDVCGVDTTDLSCDPEYAGCP